MKGILYTPDNIKAVVDLRKTVTRRLDGLKEINKEPDKWVFVDCIDGQYGFTKTSQDGTITCKLVKPRYQVGEVVYVKEKALYWEGGAGGCSGVAYQDDPEIEDLLKDNDLLATAREKINKDEPIIGKWKWRSPMFLKATYARYHQKILSVRPERLQEITEEDAIAEGCTIMVGVTSGGSMGLASARYAYKDEWNSINPKYPWDLNPWVFRYETKLVFLPR